MAVNKNLFSILISLSFLVLATSLVNVFLISHDEEVSYVRRDQDQNMRIAYFHGGRVFVPYRAYVFGEFEKAGLSVDFYTTTAKEGSKELLPVPKNVVEVQNIRDRDPLFGRFTGREILENIMAGMLDGGAIGESSFIEAAEKGLPIVAVVKLGHDTQETKGKALIIRKGSDITEPEDFIGKTIISRDAGPGDSTFLREFLDSIGINPDEVNIVDYVHPNYMMEGLIKEEVDGGYYHHMTVQKVVEAGLAEIYQPFDWVNPELSHALLVFRRDYYDTHKEEIKKFIEVYIDRIIYEEENPAEEYYKQDGVEERGLLAHLKFAGMDIPRFSYPPLIEIGLLNEMQDLLQKHGQVEYSSVDLTPYIDQSLLLELIEERNSN